MAIAGTRAAGLVWLGIVLAGAAAAAQGEPPRLPLDARISANAPADWQPAEANSRVPSHAHGAHRCHECASQVSK